MLKNYFKIIQRSILRKGFYSAAKISGLTIGLVTSLFIAFYVDYEFGFDQHHEHADRIYRVGYNIKSLETDETEKQAWVSALAGPKLLKDFPEIENYTRVKQTGGLVFANANIYEATKWFFVDQSFFDVFSHQFIKGNPKTALVNPYSIVLTETQASNYFGDLWKTNALEGLEIKIAVGDTLDVTLTGVIKDPPKQSHFLFNGLISHKTRELLYDHINGWFALGTHTYLLTHPQTNQKHLEEKIEGMVMEYYGEEAQKLGYELTLFTQPLNHIHLQSNLLREIESNGSLGEVIIVGIAGILIFLIAAINFMNLSTIGDMQFSRQIGVRKVIGASRREITNLFLLHSAIFVFISMILALCFVEILLSTFNTFFETSIISLLERGVGFWFICLCLFVLITLSGGSFTAFVLSYQKPVHALKGVVNTEKGASLRKGLIIFQFIASIILLSGTFLMKQQVAFMVNQPMGFDQDGVIVIDAWMNRSLRENPDLIKQKLLQLPEVSKVSYSNSVPGLGLLQRTARPEGADNWIAMETLISDHDFLSLYNIKVISGKTFDQKSASDLNSGFILNESAADLFGWSSAEAINKKFEWGSSKQGQIIGVVKDFHYQSLQEQISPMVIHLSETGGLISVKLNQASAIDKIESAYQSLYPDHLFKFSFLDQTMQEKYNRHQKLSKVVSFFAAIAILITCIGLISLIAYTTGQRSKEIAIRKVLGANVGQVVVLLGRTFTFMVLIASAIAIPIIYYMIKWWLREFAYHIDPGLDIYLLSIMGLIGICWFTISYQAIKAALINPVHLLKEE